MTRRQARAAAQRGARFLDEQLGRGWRSEIVLSKLDMAASDPDGDGCGCVLTQLYGTYEDGLHTLSIDDDGQEDADLGFTLPERDLGLETTAAGFGRLTDEWKNELRDTAVSGLG